LKILKKAGKLPLAAKLKKPPVKSISTDGFLNKTASGNAIFTGSSRITASENDDFHWPLALAALKNASANSSRTATIEPLRTSAMNKAQA
jgi:hypothetical protein